MVLLHDAALAQAGERRPVGAEFAEDRVGVLSVVAGRALRVGPRVGWALKRISPVPALPPWTAGDRLFGIT